MGVGEEVAGIAGRSAGVQGDRPLEDAAGGQAAAGVTPAAGRDDVEVDAYRLWVVAFVTDLDEDLPLVWVRGVEDP